MNDPVEWGKSIAVMVKGYVGKAVDALTVRMDAFEQKLAAIPGGKDGIDGKAGKDGANGADGKDAPPITAEQLVEALKAMPEALDAAVAAYLAANPPAAGKDGADGINGKDAEPVSDEQIAKSVASHLALNPPAAGRDGRDGLPGIKGADGIDGKAGANGLDGLGFDDMTVEDDGDGTVTIKFARGEAVKAFTIRLPRVVDKGVFRPENEFRKGDGVTWGGSFWIAQKDAPEGKPGESGDTEWRLAVKHGRAGKDGAPGRDYTPPKPVKL